MYSDRGEQQVLPNIDSRAFKASRILVDNSFNISFHPNSATNNSMFSEKVFPNKAIVTSKYAEFNRFRNLKMRK
jgi:hypothetical protein